MLPAAVFPSLQIVAPNQPLTKRVMGSWWPIIAFSLVHVAIVVIAATQTDGTAPIVEFQQVQCLEHSDVMVAQVFDATGFPFSDVPQKVSS